MRSESPNLSRIVKTSLFETIHETTNRLRLPIVDIDTLRSILLGPLQSLGIIPQKITSHSDNISSGSLSGSAKNARWISTLQSILLRHVVPVWEAPLTQSSQLELLEQYFCPGTHLSHHLDTEIAISAYSTLLAYPITPFSIRLLVRLAHSYPIDEIHGVLFSSTGVTLPNRTTEWEELIRNVTSIPSKVANAAGLSTSTVPPELYPRNFVMYLSEHFELLVWKASHMEPAARHYASTAYLLLKMLNTGLFPSHQAHITSPLPSFFAVAFPSIRIHLRIQNMAYAAVWSALVDSLPTIATQSYLTSLVANLPQHPSSTNLSTEGSVKRSIKAEAKLLRCLVGPLDTVDEGLWPIVLSVILGGRTWDEFFARVVVCWASGLVDEAKVNTQATIRLIKHVLDVWTSPSHRKNILLPRHKYITSLLMISLSYLTPSDPTSASFLKSVSFSSEFLEAVTAYLGHMDQSIRRMGMAVAEYLAKLVNKKLDFGGWEGAGESREWITSLRVLLEDGRDGDVALPVDDVEEVSDDPSSLHVTSPVVEELESLATKNRRPTVREADSDDESLVGFATDSDDASSTRSVSPTPSELDLIEKDPTLRVGSGPGGKAKVVQPVYLVSLGELFKAGKGDGEGDYEKIEMGLRWAEELIRRKRDYGTELEENAADLTIALVSLNDNYDMPNFEERRQAALIALVACSPRVTPSCLIEQFFHNQYSVVQRFAMLNALALGARELAGLSDTVASKSIDPSRPSTAFPSRLLPARQHQKYVTTADTESSPVARIAQGITRLALQKGKAEAEEKVPEIVREKQLRVRPTGGKRGAIVDITDQANFPLQSTSGLSGAYGAYGYTLPDRTTTFKDVAAEYFIAPFISRFWLHLRSEQTREARSNSRYKGAGTGMILDSLVLAQFLRTLMVMMHAARHSIAFLRVLTPEALEVALTVGTQPLSAGDVKTEEDAEKEASVLGSALELVLVILDACVELDQGRELALEKGALLFATSDWAGRVFRTLENRGGLSASSGGEMVDKVGRAAAGVVLKVEEIMERWRRAMLPV